MRRPRLPSRWWFDGRSGRRLAASLAGLALAGAASAAAGCSVTRAAPATARPPVGPRIILVVEENHSYRQITSSPAATTLTRMASSGTLLTSYYAVRHPSLPNYIALLSGDTGGVTTDCTGCEVDAPSLATELSAAGVSWRAYLQGLPAPCSQVVAAGAYVRRHNPFLYFPTVRDDPRLCGNVVPLDRFWDDLTTGSLPRFVWITPDLEHDMHGGPGIVPDGPADQRLVQTADELLGTIYDRLVSSSAWTEDTRLVVTWDEGLRREGTEQESCCGGTATGGHVATVVVGPRVAHDTDAATYTHYSLLRSIEDAYGLPHLGRTADPAVRAIPAVTGR